MVCSHLLESMLVNDTTTTSRLSTVEVSTDTVSPDVVSIAAVAGIAVCCFMVILCAISIVVSACLYFLYFKASSKRKESQVCSSIEMGETERSGINCERHIYDSIRDTIDHPCTTIAIIHMTSKASGHVTSKATHTDILDTRHGPEEIELFRNVAYSQVSTAAVSTRHHDNHDDMNMVDNPAYQSSN